MHPETRTPSRLRSWLLGVPVFVKVMGIVLGMAGVLGTGMLWQVHRTFQSHLRRDLEQRGYMFANHLASHCCDLMHAHRTPEIEAELAHSLGELPEAIYLILEDRAGTVLAQARVNDARAESAAIHEVTVLPEGSDTRLRLGISLARVEADIVAFMNTLTDGYVPAP